MCCAVGDDLLMSSADVSQMNRIVRLIGVYDADHTVRGELAQTHIAAGSQVTGWSTVFGATCPGSRINRGAHRSRRAETAGWSTVFGATRATRVGRL